MKSKEIKKELKKSLRKLGREYKRSLKSGSNPWLTDNYYCFEREGQALISSFSDKRDRPLSIICSEIFEKCVFLYENNLISDSKAVTDLICEKGVSLIAIEYAPMFFKAAAIIDAAEKSDESTTQKAVKSIMQTDETDYMLFAAEFSEKERLLNRDETYARMTDECKSLYRKRIFYLSKKSKKSETEIINGLLLTERHIGFGLFNRSKSKNTVFIFTETALAFFISAFIAVFLRQPLLFAVLLFPVWKIADAVISDFQIKKNPPKQLFRLDKKEIPDEARTLVTVSTLLSGAKNSRRLEEHLTKIYASNRDKNIFYALLVDKKEFTQSEKPDDRANIRAVSGVIERLNKRFDNRFFLFIRPREYSRTGMCFTGKNRKMGAFSALVKLIKTGENSFETIIGDKSLIPSFKYILALDSDTLPDFQSVRKLVMTASHPLNRAVIDKEKRKVESGYGIFSVSVMNRLIDENDTFFSLIMSGSGGSNAYDSLCADRFSDVFDSGIFAGKGLIDIDAYHTVICDRFKDEKILSHDIIEGEFLSTLFVSDVQFADAFPKSEGSFLLRQHRWIRGDWQNLPFLFTRPSILAKREPNPLSFISRYKIFDNLRRSVTPVFSLLLILLSVLFDEKTAAIMISTALLSVCVDETVSFFKSLFSGGIAMLSRLYYSFALPEALNRIMQAAINISMLPCVAVKNLDAVFKALFRQFVTKRKMLEWTSFADSEKNSSFAFVLVHNLFSILCSVYLCVFHTPYTVLCSIFFIFNILFEYFSQKPISKSETSLDALTQERLISHAAAQWKYFEEYSNEADNFLPADNVQYAPVFRIAHRTSPTNIGLMLVCVFVAYKNEFIGKNEMIKRIDGALTSIEKLEKWNGNLLNWYDTKTLRALEPKFISTVDSGNFLCSLTALKQGLDGICSTDRRIKPLSERIEKIILETDLTPLYNKKRKLFHIGFDLSENRLSGSYYDLLMSEARMTSYYAVSRGIVDRKHWSALSRLPGKKGRYTGPLSWSGTMFEYFMPNIFMPARKNTFSYEGLRFCLYCQTQYARTKKIPWGVSESAFYSFDSFYNYQYKAHGVNSVRLSRSNTSDTVISPYSSYLALPFAKKKAASNIKRLEKMHMFGPCGLYEAADFTKERTDAAQYKIVKSYMAHHIGMSMLSIINAVDNFSIQKMFMSEIDMAAGNTLLDERIPTFTPIIRAADRYSPRQRDERRERFVHQSESVSSLRPGAQAYSNGEWTLTVCENGVTKSTWLDKCVFRHDGDFLFNPHSLAAVFRTEKKTVHFSPFLNPENADAYKCVFRDNEAVISFNDGEFKLSEKMSVHKFLPGEKRVFTIQNNSKRSVEGELLIYFEPCLTTEENEKSHPAFSHLFVTKNFDEKEKILSFTRRDRNEKDSLSLACFLSGAEKYSYSCCREEILRRPFGIFSLEKCRKPFSDGSVPDCCGLYSVRVRLGARQKLSLSLIFTVAKSVKQAKEMIINGKSNGLLTDFENAKCIFSNMPSVQPLAREILPNLIFRPDPSDAACRAIKANNRSVDALWSKGISGDRPIILFRIDSDGDLNEVRHLIRLHNTFSNAFIKNDLVFFCASALEDAVKSALRNESVNRGGIFVINTDDCDSETLNFLYAYSAFFANERNRQNQLSKPFLPIEIHSGERRDGENKATDDGYLINRPPVLPWCFIYSNERFGTLVSDKSAGFTYCDNSFLNKLSVWSNDTRTDFNSELILIRISGKVFNPLINANVNFTGEKAIYTCLCDGVSVTVKISVDEKKPRKNIEVFLSNKSDLPVKVEAVYSVEPVLSHSTGNQRMLHIEKGSERITVANPLNRDFRGEMTLGIDRQADIFVFDKISLFNGEWQAETPFPVRYPIAAIGKKINLTGEYRILFSLGFTDSNADAEITKENRIEIHSPDKNLDLLTNTFLPVQIIRGRLQARTGFYQCSGAYGFRDQLQDALSLSILSPERLKKQILLNASAQFTQGDCMHWFHKMPDGELRGVRTRYSDDRLWLAYAVSEYVSVTGDAKFLDEKAPFLRCSELENNETERYVCLHPCDEYGTVYEHCVRAIEKSLAFGRNGLPLILGGDWNDGFNTVGKCGKGESVWLGEFLITVLENFAVLCDGERKRRYLETAEELRRKIDENAYEDSRYIRAFLDDGSPVGNEKNRECKIDSLSQSFAVFCNMPDKARVNAALESAYTLLVDKEHALIKLFSDGFENDRRAGYISAYPVGLRENAGQYTHAAVWLAKAFIQFGQADTGYELMSFINPLNKYENEKTATRYMTEPYFLAGDVYSAKGIEGRGGWSIYTGSAAWYYKTVTEDIFGLKKRGDRLFISPAFPSGWEKCRLKLTLDGNEYEIEYVKSDRNCLTVDSAEADFLALDGKGHKIIVNFCGK